MPSPFDDDAVAREALETIRWPDGPRCPHCASCGADVFKIGGEKHSHREGLYQCKPCRRQFSVTVGTPLERLRVPLSTWFRAALAFSYVGPTGRRYAHRNLMPPLTQLATEIGVSYRTVLRMRDLIKHAASNYRGYKNGFGLWPRSFMKHNSSPGQAVNYRDRKQKLLDKGKHPAQHTIKATGVLAKFMPESTKTETRTRAPSLRRAEQLLRLLLGASKPSKKRRPKSTRGRRDEAPHGQPQNQ
jgi:transposase-like protein